VSRIRLLLDADTRLLLASALRDGGHDAVHVNEIGMGSALDPDVLAYAVAERRAVFTHNVDDFMALADAHARAGKPYWGIVVSRQAAFWRIRRRLLRFLGERTAEEIRDTALWLP
jgi:predicted nuclease of predicted toxin-antitoxin system